MDGDWAAKDIPDQLPMVKVTSPNLKRLLVGDLVVPCL